eukprot:16445313-Heterocapsa_arctica.AAC.1
MYGEMLLPQSSYADPTAGRGQQMTSDDDDNNLTPQQTPNTQTTQNGGTGNGPGSSQPGQGDQHAEPTKQKTWMDNDPMRGIKYAPLSGPGPSGFRPEFIIDLMTVRKKCVTRRLKRTLSTFFLKAGKGELPDEMKWIL